MDAGCLVEPSIHQEANEPLRAGADQKWVDKSDVIGGEQCAALLWKVLTAPHFNAVEGVSQQPEAESNGGVGQDRKDVGRRSEGKRSHHQQYLVR